MRDQRHAKTVAQRVAAVAVRDANGCLVMPRKPPSQSYPQMTVGSRLDGTRRLGVWVHRALWEEANGPLPKGKCLHPCVREQDVR